MTSPIHVRADGPVVEVTLSRPERLNAFDGPMIQALREALQQISLDPRHRAVLLTGAGSAFCAGGDVQEMERVRTRGSLPELFHTLSGELELVIRELLLMPKPVVAALPGVAAGGGLSLALAADWRIASTRGVLVPAFGQLGAVPDGGLTYFLPHFLGIGLAQELLFKDSRVVAERARELGLVHEVVPPEELPARARARASELAEGPTFAYGWTKRLLASAYSNSLETQMVMERRAAVEAAVRPELAEGILAFVEKRRPRFPAP